MKERFVTITGFRYCYGLEPLKIGELVRCKKEPDNRYDSEAIVALMPVIGKVGYLANSTNTVAGGTSSAGRIYDSVPKTFFVRVRFTSFTKVICSIEENKDGVIRPKKAKLYKRGFSEIARKFKHESYQNDDDDLLFIED
ncbi:MAG: HIRAN domain-containing protein [Oscillospiraceae bacterium]